MPVHRFAGALQRLVDSKGCASCRCHLRRHGWRDVLRAAFSCHGGLMPHDVVPLVLLCLPLAGGAVLHTVVPWLPSLGLDLVLRVDGLAWLFLLLICGIGLLVAVYARYYMP